MLKSLLSATALCATFAPSLSPAFEIADAAAPETAIHSQTTGRDNSKSFTAKIPILTVSGNEESGDCMELPFLLERNPESKESLRIDISEDVPTGSTEAFRSSVWMATVTAGLQRSDPLNGTRVRIDFSGWLDGPSAGAVLCLATLSALDGREFPQDFAMTGTILPDGTIGMVGGVAEKIKAAANAGKKRVAIPAFLRFEPTLDGEGITDLFSIGKTLGIEVRPVSTIADAYAYAHNLPPPVPFSKDVRDIRILPNGFETVLLMQHFANNQSKEYIIENANSTLSNLIKSDAINFLGEQLFDSSDLPALLSGRTLEAAEVALLNSSVSQAAESFVALQNVAASLDYETMSEAQLRSILPALRNLASYLSGIWLRDPDLGQTVFFYPDDDWMSDISAQLESDENPFFLALLDQLRSNFFSGEEPQDVSDMDKEGLEREIRFRLHEIFLLNIFYASDERTDEARLEQARTMPQIPANENLSNVEKLFRAAWLAADASFNKDTINSLEDIFCLKRDDILEILAGMDFYLVCYSCEASDAILKIQKMDESAKKGDQYTYHETKMMLTEAAQLASAASLIVKYDSGAVDFQVDEDLTIQPQNTDVLSELLRTARVQALRSIDECNSLGIPCPASWDAFEQAESDRDSCGKDELIDNVLRYYWTASLTAKALTMAFAKEDGTAWDTGDYGPTEWEKSLASSSGASEINAQIQAALQGNPDARNRIGIRFCRGDGLPRNPQRGAIWLLAAAKQGQRNAQFNYAKLLESGEVGAYDPDEVVLWMREAAENGHPKAIQWLSEHPELLEPKG